MPLAWNSSSNSSVITAFDSAITSPLASITSWAKKPSHKSFASISYSFKPDLTTFLKAPLVIAVLGLIR